MTMACMTISQLNEWHAWNQSKLIDLDKHGIKVKVK